MRITLRILFAAAVCLLATACRPEEDVETTDIVSFIPWTPPEQLEYQLLDREDGSELGRGTLSIESEGNSQYALSLDFSDEENYDNARVIVGVRTLKPQSVHRERMIDEERVQIDAEYDPIEDVVTITEIRDEEERPIPHRLKDNYYDNDSSLFIWRTIPFEEGYEAAYHTVVTGSGEQQLVRIEVVRKERLTVPAGTFDTWRIEVRAERARQIVWYADTPERPLIQYDNGRGGQLFQLVSPP
jgi:hypothetical protein